MLVKLLSHARHNAVAYLALFVAMGGTAVAAKPMLTGADLQDGTINGADLRDRDSTSYPGPSIQGTDVEANSLTGAEIDEASLGKVANADTLDSKDSADFLGATATAADADKLDGKDSTDFLGANAKAANSDRLDSFDSTELKSDRCPSGYVSDGAICWENFDEFGYTLAGAANKCRLDGGRLPLLSEFEALAKSGIALGNCSRVGLDRQHRRRRQQHLHQQHRQREHGRRSGEQHLFVGSLRPRAGERAREPVTGVAQEARKTGSISSAASLPVPG